MSGLITFMATATASCSNAWGPSSSNAQSFATDGHITAVRRLCEQRITTSIQGLLWRAGGSVMVTNCAHGGADP
jgi:hypothetical protein